MAAHSPIIYSNSSHVFHADMESMHPESPRRVEAILATIAPYVDSGALRLHTFASDAVPMAAVPSLRSWKLKDGDTYKTIYTDAILKVTHRMLCVAVDDLVCTKTRCGFVLCRPPGHHASVGGPAGFCHSNTVWAAVQLLLRRGLRRIAIYDWDAHHGDGTQSYVRNATGEEYDHIRFVSTHAHGRGIYPGTGDYEKTDRVLSIPFRRGTRHAEFLQVFHEEVLPFLNFTSVAAGEAAAAAAAPEIVLVSAGYDGHTQDPMELMRLEHDTYGTLSDALRVLGCPVLFLLEGGYNPEVLAKCVLETLRPWM